MLEIKILRILFSAEQKAPKVYFLGHPPTVDAEDSHEPTGYVKEFWSKFN